MDGSAALYGTYPGKSSPSPGRMSGVAGGGIYEEEEEEEEEEEKMVDEYPSYGGTPSRAPQQEVVRPRRSISAMLSKGLGALLSPARGGTNSPSGRLSDADELQLHYNEIRRSNAAAASSPLRGDHLDVARTSYNAPPSAETRVQVAYTIDEASTASSVAFDVMNNNNNSKVVPPGCETDATISFPRPEPIYLQFTEVKYKVVTQEAAKWRGKGAVEKEILHGVSGSVGAGEMLAMMGPSGSGKTTLLNVLGGRRSNPQLISGSILYNDVPYSKNLKRRIGFVTQDDVLFPHLTVAETLSFSAQLRLPTQMLSREAKVERAKMVMAELGLQRCQDTIIGNQFLRGISGGERKRVCIGQEILTNPSLIFLDEPTSGLDSTTALRIIRLLQNIAHQGRAVMATIHQPSSRAFHMFDKLILLSDGYPAYFGKAQGALTYFDSIGFTPLIPMNPADFLLDLCSGNVNDMSIPNVLTKQQGVNKEMSNLANVNGGTPSTIFAKDVKKYLKDRCEEQMSTLDRAESLQNQKSQHGISSSIVNKRRNWSTSWWEQFLVLFIRGFKARRNEYLSWLRVIQVVFSALLGGCLWWQSKHSTPWELQDQSGLLFFIGVFWGYFPLFTAIFTFPIERSIMAKERAADMYRVSAYFMARTLSDLPIELGLAVIFILILYFMANLRRTLTAFVFTIATVCLDVITSQGVGFFIGAALMDVQKASTFASVFVLAFMLAGGFFVKNIPPFIGWIKYISFQAHTYEILMEVQYGHTIMVKSWTLRYQNSILAMVIMVFGYRILAYLALRRMKISA